MPSKPITPGQDDQNDFSNTATDQPQQTPQQAPVSVSAPAINPVNATAGDTQTQQIVEPSAGSDSSSNPMSFSQSIAENTSTTASSGQLDPAQGAQATNEAQGQIPPSQTASVIASSGNVSSEHLVGNVVSEKGPDKDTNINAILIVVLVVLILGILGALAFFLKPWKAGFSFSEAIKQFGL